MRARPNPPWFGRRRRLLARASLSIKDPHAQVDKGSEDEEIDLATSKEVLYRFANRLTKVQEVRRDERGFSRKKRPDGW